MTDTMPEQSEDWSDVENSANTYPEYPGNPHNHRFTLSYDPQKPPFLVVRANTVADLKEAFQELEDGGVYAAMGNAWRVMKAQASVGAGLGPTTPVEAPQGPPAPPQGAVPPPFGPNVSVPGAPGYAGPPVPQAPMPPAPPQGQWSGQAPANGNRGPKPRPADWPVCYKIDVPFQQKDAFKAHREQYKDYFKGKVAWAGGGGYWVHGDVVQAMAAYNPVPA